MLYWLDPEPLSCAGDLKKKKKKFIFVMIWGEGSEIEWLLGEKGNPTGRWLFCPFSCPNKLNLLRSTYLISSA